MRKRSLIAGIITAGILALSHHFWLNEFQFEIFTIILVLSYLLSYKLVDYVADFKTVKEKSRIEIIFLAVFFVILFIPMLHISDAKNSERENRTLAKYKPLISEGKINYNFGKDFDIFYSDRFFLREFIIDMMSIIKYKVASEWYLTSRAMISKKTHFSFINSEVRYPDIVYDKKTVENIIENVNKLNKFCEENKAKLYILVVPHSPDVYHEQVPKFYNYSKIMRNKHDFIKKIQTNTKANVIYPFKRLDNEKTKDYVYFKQDHHWTDYGAYIGYLELINEIKKDFPQVSPVDKKDYKIFHSKLVKADWDRKFQLGQRIRNDFPFLKKSYDLNKEVDYTYFEHKNKSLLSVSMVRNNQKLDRTFYYPLGTDLRVFQLGTSMGENLIGFTAHTFKHVKFQRSNAGKNRNRQEFDKLMKYHGQEIIDYKPDILILVLTLANMRDAGKWFAEYE